jgi:hypothetical protein
MYRNRTGEIMRMLRFFFDYQNNRGMAPGLPYLICSGSKYYTKFSGIRH